MKNLSETKILIVEDDTFLRRSLSRFISQKGYSTLEAENGLEALKIFKNETPALVLTDIRMPVMDGLNLLDELTAESPHTPVIILSGMTDNNDILAALRQGAWDYITKPVNDVAFLMDRIEKALVKAQTASVHLGLAEESFSDENSKYKDELTKRKKLERQIANAQQEWQRTTDAISDPIALLDKNHNLLRTNTSMAKLFDKSPHEIVDQTRYLSTGGFDNQEKAVIDFKTLLIGQKLTGRFYDEGSQAHYEVTMTPYYGSDDITIIGCIYLARVVQNR